MTNGEFHLGILQPKLREGVSQVWQAKGLREAIFGWVANKGVTDEILDLGQIEDLEQK
jgi:hypothetical protein